MQIFNNKKQKSYGFATCLSVAEAVSAQLPNVQENSYLEKIELAQAGKGDPAKSNFFLNLYLKNEFVEGEINRLVKEDCKLK